MTKIIFKILCLAIIGAPFASCSTLHGPEKHELTDGIYQFKTQDKKTRRIYLQREEDSLVIYPMQPGSRIYADTTNPLVLEREEKGKQGMRDYYIFKQPSFDIDILTILFKYRPKQEMGPRQLNTDFNAALYVGFRSDSYTIDYTPTPLNTFKKDIRQRGYSVGFFTGLGSTMVAPWFTNDQVQIEYDGLVFINGVAANIAYNNLTFGLGIGIDYLLDSNRKHWVYQGKPWIGFTLGLNLN